jgi:hypothetical protein
MWEWSRFTRFSTLDSGLRRNDEQRRIAATGCYICRPFLHNLVRPAIQNWPSSGSTHRYLFLENLEMRALPTLKVLLACLMLMATLCEAANVSAQTRFHGMRAGSAQGYAGGGGYTNWSNGATTHEGRHWANGVNGGSFSGHNSYSKNAGGSGQANFSNSGHTAAGGNTSGSGAYSKSANGSWSGNSQSSGSGSRGSYQTSTTTANGVTTHMATATNANGQTYEHSGTYTQGQGYSRSTSGQNGN